MIVMTRKRMVQRWTRAMRLAMGAMLLSGLAISAQAQTQLQSAPQSQGAPKSSAKAKASAAQANASANANSDQGGGSPPGAPQGFSQNGKQPIHIDAAKLEVRDKDKVATFSGDVRVTQGDTVLKARSLVVFYDGDATAASGPKTASNAPAPSGAPGQGGSQRIRKIEARGNVIVTQKEQTVTGELAVFDMKSNTVTMSGGILLTQGKSVMRGESVVMDMTTGVTKVEPGKGGRINMMMEPQGGGAPQANPLQPR